MKRDYAKVFLYAYPWMKALSEAMAQAAENKALLSYRSPLSAEEAAGRVVAEYAMQAAVEELYLQMERVVGAMTEEELYLLEYKYFRRAGRLSAGEGVVLPYSERSYFRRQSELVGKVTRLLGDMGWTDSRFVAVFGRFSPFLKILRAIRAGKEREVWQRRKQSGLTFCGEARPGGPRRTFSPRKASSPSGRKGESGAKGEGAKGAAPKAGGTKKAAAREAAARGAKPKSGAKVANGGQNSARSGSAAGGRLPRAARAATPTAAAQATHIPAIAAAESPPSSSSSPPAGRLAT